MKRRLLAGTAVLLWLLLVLVWSAGLRPGMPWQPAQSVVLDGSELKVIMGTGSSSADGLRVSGLGRSHQGIQTWRLPEAIDTARLHMIRYRVEDFPPTLELSLLFRTQEKPRNVQAVTIPVPDDGSHTLDLGNVPVWQGHVTEIGFSQYPLPSHTPRAFPFTSFVLQSASLTTPSIRAQLQALAGRWQAWMPWSMQSINVHKPAMPMPVRNSPELMLGLMLVGSLLLLSLFGQLQQQPWRILLPALLLPWLLLDARWLSQLQRHQQLGQTLFQDQPWSARKHITGDQRLQQFAAVLRKVLASQDPGRHVLYWTPQAYDMARLGYLLRPHNVASLTSSITSAQLPSGTLLLIDNLDNTWQWDPHRQLLRRGNQQFHGTVIWHQGRSVLLRTDKGGDA